MADDLIINAHELSGLELAKYVLLRLIDGKTIEDIAENFDNNKKLVSETVEFLLTSYYNVSSWSLIRFWCLMTAQQLPTKRQNGSPFSSQYYIQ